MSNISVATLSSLFPVSSSAVFPINLAFFSGYEVRSRFCFYKAGKLKSSSFRLLCCSSGKNSVPSGENSSSFCIIEGPETVEDFVQMQLQELDDNIRSRRNKIFLLMEEVRRLRIQQRIRSAESNNERSDENEMPDMPSAIPFLSNMTPKTMKQLYLTSFSMVSGIIMFGGLLSPIELSWNWLKQHLLEITIFELLVENFFMLFSLGSRWVKELVALNMIYSFH